VVPIREIAAARIILFDFQNLDVCLAMTDPIGNVIANRQFSARHCESPAKTSTSKKASGDVAISRKEVRT
jgi:hypothetical protein